MTNAPCAVGVLIYSCVSQIQLYSKNQPFEQHVNKAKKHPKMHGRKSDFREQRKTCKYEKQKKCNGKCKERLAFFFFCFFFICFAVFFHFFSGKNTKCFIFAFSNCFFCICFLVFRLLFFCFFQLSVLAFAFFACIFLLFPIVFSLLFCLFFSIAFL